MQILQIRILDFMNTWTRWCRLFSLWFGSRTFMESISTLDDFPNDSLTIKNGRIIKWKSLSGWFSFGSLLPSAYISLWASIHLQLMQDKHVGAWHFCGLVNWCLAQKISEHQPGLSCGSWDVSSYFPGHPKSSSHTWCLEVFGSPKGRTLEDVWGLKTPSQ